jgi:hypothetical protein
MERIVVIPDMQIPYHSEKHVSSLMRYVEAVKPHLACVGDELDCPQASRWTKGTAKEFEGTLQRDINTTKDILRMFRDAQGHDKTFWLQRSNHTQRLEHYIRQYAPAFSSIDVLKIEKLLDLDGLGITYNRALAEIAPNVLLAHGDEGRMFKDAGRTALDLAKRTGKHVICGHTHRAGIAQESTGFAGKQSVIWGMEVGNMMNMKSSGAGYLKEKIANWQHGFGILWVEGNFVKPEMIPMDSKGRFIADGELWD